MFIHKNIFTLPRKFTGSYTEDEPNFPRQNNLILQKMVSGVDKVVNFKDFSRSNKEIKYFSRRLLSNQPRFQARKPSCLFPSELNKMAFAAIRRRHFCLKMNGRKGRIRKTYCSNNVTYFWMSICKTKKTTCLYPETVTKGGRLVKNITNCHLQYLEDVSRIPSIRV